MTDSETLMRAVIVFVILYLSVYNRSKKRFKKLTTLQCTQLEAKNLLCTSTNKVIKTIKKHFFQYRLVSITNKSDLSDAIFLAYDQRDATRIKALH